jgi:hypothetical protein
MREKYTFGWSDPRAQFGEAIKAIENKIIIESNVPVWFKLAVKLFYWLKNRI